MKFDDHSLIQALRLPKRGELDRAELNMRLHVLCELEALRQHQNELRLCEKLLIARLEQVPEWN